MIGVGSESYEYDALGRLVSADDDVHEPLGFVYDGLSRLVSETNHGTTVQYTYDANNNRISLSASGVAQEFSYDALDRLTQAHHNDTRIATYEYTGLEHRTTIHGNDRTTTMTYDPRMRLRTLIHGGDGFDAQLGQYTYTYDPVGNIIGDGQQIYRYDSLDRLTHESYLQQTQRNGTQSTRFHAYVYDPMGNRIQRKSHIEF